VPRVKPIIKKDDKTETANKVSSNNRRSADLEKSEDNSLYVSALEDVNDSMKRTRRSSNKVNNIFSDILLHMISSNSHFLSISFICENLLKISKFIF